jgi:serine kinase of HPr protein (carbohydrate metabolism regulator)
MRLHATAFLVGERGVVVTGPSGAGKSSLFLALLARPPRLPGAAAPALVRLVGDDQIHVEAAGGRLIARGDPRLAGRVEARGLGILAVPHEAACVIGLVVERAPAARLPSVHSRMTQMAGVRVPLVAIAPDDPDPVARLALVLGGHGG